MLNWALSKLQSKMQESLDELAEIQKRLDDSAHKIVDGIVRLIDHEPDEIIASRDAIPGRDFHWYDEIGAALAADGFGPPIVVASRESLARPVEARTMAEFALGDGGTLVATWFELRAKEGGAGRRGVTLTTVMQDGHVFETTRNYPHSHLPILPTLHRVKATEDVPLGALVAGHRARVAQHGVPARPFADYSDHQRWEQQDREANARFRREQGLGLVERYIESRFADSPKVAQEYLRSVRAHPEWYKYAEAKPTTDADAAPPKATPPAAAPKGELALTFLASRNDEGRHTVTSFGMLFAGLPELLVRGAAPNHSRAARFLLGTTAHAISRHRAAPTGDDGLMAALVAPSGARLDLLAVDAASIGGVPLRPVAPGTSAPVHIALTGFGSDSEGPELLGIDPLPGTAGSFDERLRALCAQLGCDVPVAAPADSMQSAMDAAHERAVARLGEIREKFLAGISPGEKICVKTHVVAGDVGEYVWLEVREWNRGEIAGDVLTPAPRIQLAAGQRLVIVEERVYDYVEVGPQGIKSPAATDVVAIDYGMDI